jgi:AbrB family looped-hinge helix DNA binding protein
MLAVDLPSAIPSIDPPLILSATVTSKGQLTLPIELRRQLGVETGTKIHFVIHDGKAELIPEQPADSYFGCLEFLGNFDSTIPKEIDRLL